MLDRIRLQNFKTHRDTEIQLGRLTVLVGPNGAGKSSVLQAIHQSTELARLGPITLNLKSLARDGEEIGSFLVELKGTSGRKAWSVTLTESPLPPTEQSVLNAEVTTALLAPSPDRMAVPVPLTAITPMIASDGYGLADVIAAMRDVDEIGFHSIQTALRGIVPQIDRILIKRAKLPRDSIGNALFFDVSGRKGIPASQMSGGTLLALAILALLHSPQRPRILLLDDIDHGLHPKAQWDLLRQLRRLLEQYPDLQIVATSHSPDLVDELDPSEVVVMALRPDGTSAAKPLTACPREDMLGVLRAGQLWSAVGEDWVTVDAPSAPEPQP